MYQRRSSCSCVRERELDGRLALEVGLAGAPQRQADGVFALAGGGLADVEGGLCGHPATPFAATAHRRAAYHFGASVTAPICQYRREQPPVSKGVAGRVCDRTGALRGRAGMPSSIPVALMSSSMSGQCTPSPLPMISKLLRCPGVASDRRHDHASRHADGTPIGQFSGNRVICYPHGDDARGITHHNAHSKPPKPSADVLQSACECGSVRRAEMLR